MRESNSAAWWEQRSPEAWAEAAPTPAGASPFAGGAATSLGRAAETTVDYLSAGSKWGGPRGTGASVDYSFPTASSTWAPGYGAGEPTAGFGAFNAAQKAAAVKALAAWAEVANISFHRITETAGNVGDIRFGISDAPSTAWAYYPAKAEPEGGDVWLGGSGHRGETFYLEGTYLYHTVLHEIGHAIGLKHPHESIGAGTASSTDWLGLSVMSYRSYPHDDLSGYSNDFFPYRPMLWDIQAIQALYGANMSTRSGDTVYQWGHGEQLFETIWDGGGHDRIDWSNQASAATIDLQAGHWSALGPAYTWWDTGTGQIRDTLAIARGVTIEDASGGSASDRIDGNNAANRLAGNAGGDTLWGEGGTDSLVGGTGNDWLYGGPDGDRLAGGDGVDRLRGGPGVDQLTGGLGADRFVFDDGESGLGSARDRVLDFARGQGDLLDLGAIDADATRAGDQAFAWRGAAALTGAAQLGFFHAGQETVIRASIDADGASELEILLAGDLNPDRGWFVL